MGAIEEGTTNLDYEPEEVRRRGSVRLPAPPISGTKTGIFCWTFRATATSPATWNALLKGVDGVLFVLDAVDGVRPLTKKFWNMTRAEKLPSVIVINKLDRDRADFHMAFDSLTALGVKPVALQLPIRKGTPLWAWWIFWRARPGSSRPTARPARRKFRRNWLMT